MERNCCKQSLSEPQQKFKTLQNQNTVKISFTNFTFYYILGLQGASRSFSILTFNYCSFFDFFHGFEKSKFLTEIFSIHPQIFPGRLGSCEVQQKIGPHRFSCFDVSWLQTNKQTPRQAKYIYRIEYTYFTTLTKTCFCLVFKYS